MRLFKTADGFRLRGQPDGTWADGNLVFASGIDGSPIDSTGKRVPGRILRLKVYREHDGTFRCMVAAASMQEAATLLNTTVHGIKAYGGVCEGPEAAIALAEPGVVFWQDMRGCFPERNPWTKERYTR